MNARSESKTGQILETHRLRCSHSPPVHWFNQEHRRLERFGTATGFRAVGELQLAHTGGPRRIAYARLSVVQTSAVSQSPLQFLSVAASYYGARNSVFKTRQTL